MARWNQPEDDFCCPYRDHCPHLEGLSTHWVWLRYQDAAGLECRYEYIIEQLEEELRQERRLLRDAQREIQELRAQLQALHRRQFKGRTTRPETQPKDCPSKRQKKRGAPVGHPPWQRRKPKDIDQFVAVPAPKECPHCHNPELQAVGPLHEHVQEDIVLQPKSEATCFVHKQGYCARCGRNVWQAGPGELVGSYIGPAAKATAIYLRYELNVSQRKISRFFKDFFGLSFVPASAYGFERQAAGKGRPLYEDLKEKIRALPVAHLDDTSWRHDGEPYVVWYAGNDDLAYLHLDAHRTTEVAQSILGKKFSGILVSDALASYDGIERKDWQSCLAHIKTKAKNLQQEIALLKGRGADPQAGRFCQSIQGFVHEVCRAHQKFCRGRWRARAARRKGEALQQSLRELCQTPLRYAKAESFRRRLLGEEQKYFFTCFRHPKVPPTNNQAERSLRPVVIMRKIIQGTRSAGGLENHSILRSLFETSRRQGKKPYEFFRALFTQSAPDAQRALYRKPLPKKPAPPQRC